MVINNHHIYKDLREYLPAIASVSGNVESHQTNSNYYVIVIQGMTVCWALIGLLSETSGYPADYCQCWL